MAKITKEELRDMILRGEDINCVDYSHIRDTSYMFKDCKELVKMPYFNMVNVTNAEGMFLNCINLKEAFIVGTRNLSNTFKMFDGCESLAKKSTY
jgi:hypothetical protein